MTDIADLSCLFDDDRGDDDASPSWRLAFGEMTRVIAAGVVGRHRRIVVRRLVDALGVENVVDCARVCASDGASVDVAVETACIVLLLRNGAAPPLCDHLWRLPLPMLCLVLSSPDLAVRNEYQRYALAWSVVGQRRVRWQPNTLAAIADRRAFDGLRGAGIALHMLTPGCLDAVRRDGLVGHRRVDAALAYQQRVRDAVLGDEALAGQPLFRFVARFDRLSARPLGAVIDEAPAGELFAGSRWSLRMRLGDGAGSRRIAVALMREPAPAGADGGTYYVDRRRDVTVSYRVSLMVCRGAAALVTACVYDLSDAADGATWHPLKRIDVLADRGYLDDDGGLRVCVELTSC